LSAPDETTTAVPLRRSGGYPVPGYSQFGLHRRKYPRQYQFSFYTHSIIVEVIFLQKMTFRWAEFPFSGSPRHKFGVGSSIHPPGDAEPEAGGGGPVGGIGWIDSGACIPQSAPPDPAPVMSTYRKKVPTSGVYSLCGSSSSRRGLPGPFLRSAVSPELLSFGFRGGC
jgi:hypothetical protein